MRYLQADKIKLLHKRLPRCIFGASEIDMTERNQQDDISNEANRKIEIN